MSHPIENMLRTTMEQLHQIVDVNTVVGAPVAVDGAVILPVSKVSLGFLTGGGEYEGKDGVVRCGRALDETPQPFPFTGASAVGLCLTPVAFLTIQDGHVCAVSATCEGTLERLIDRAPQLLAEAERMITTLLERRKRGNGDGTPGGVK